MVKRNRRYIKVMSDFSALFWNGDGVCIGSAGDDLDDDWIVDFKMSDKLKEEFYQWHEEFENDALKEPCPINWIKYNQRGRELTDRLRQELGNDVKVVYVEPYESYYYLAPN